MEIVGNNQYNQPNMENIDEPENDPPNAPSNKRMITQSSWMNDYHLYSCEPSCFLTDIDQENHMEPITYSDVIKSHEKDLWLEAMNDEIDSMKRNSVWELCDLPEERKAIGCKWVFKKKLWVDGSIDKFKARLVAKGYIQKEGIDFQKTYSPVAKFASIRIILAIVAHLDLELHQMDVKTAFLNGELQEDIYIC